MVELFLVSLGGAIGACIRYSLGEWIKEKKISVLITTIAMINIVGSTLLGVALGLSLTVKLELFTVSLLGGFTTFSTFSLEAYEFFRAKEWRKATAYIAVSIVGSLLGFSLVILFFL
ncbi:fluoride efflux transporter FluC [Shouchella patagoniensis]|uniref:fluoride efflux transporter FluC n=1 Tax=Shouchella patagoniensis TaxID=228576 RepID=UPI0009955E5B|nr:CrcB family protein [Shouchella patagoniensis]